MILTIFFKGNLFPYFWRKISTWPASLLGTVSCVPSARTRSTCRGRGGAGQPRPFIPPRQGAANRRAHEATVAAGAGAGQPRSASAATTFRTFAVGQTTIARCAC